MEILIRYEDIFLSFAEDVEIWAQPFSKLKRILKLKLSMKYHFLTSSKRCSSSLLFGVKIISPNVDANSKYFSFTINKASASITRGILRFLQHSSSRTRFAREVCERVSPGPTISASNLDENLWNSCSFPFEIFSSLGSKGIVMISGDEALIAADALAEVNKYTRSAP